MKDDTVTAPATAHWDTTVTAYESGELKGWLDWDFVEEEYIRPQISGDRAVYYVDHFVRTHLRGTPVERALSLGCGGGNLERSFVEMNTARQIDGLDYSPVSIDLARELAEKGGMADRLHYEVCDMNEKELPEGVYDFVVAKMALHHFENLEHVYRQIARALKPDGVFMFNEFVGPSRFQWTDLQLSLMNELLAALPEEVRRRSGVEQIARPTIAEMVEMDPSESVRSAEILPVLDESFDIVEYKPYGGTLLHILLSNVMRGFDLSDENHRALLRVLFSFERNLILRGVLESDFAYVVARPKGRPLRVHTHREIAPGEPPMTHLEFDHETLPWTDRETFAIDLEDRKREDRLGREKAKLLAQWNAEGYLHLSGLIEEELLDQVLEDYEEAWSSRPDIQILVEGKGFQPFSSAAPREELTHHHYRLIDFHDASEATRELVLHPDVVDMVRLILDDTPVVMQSLFFEYGSEQYAHQDFPYVQAQILSHLVGCWIACEDVTPENGPVFYYPRSHRISKFDWGPELGLRSDGCDPDKVIEFERFVEHQCVEAGLERRPFCAKKGDVLLWHAALVHGGSPVNDKEATRRSLVVHYSSLTGYPRDRRAPHQVPRRIEKNGAVLYERPDGGDTPS